MSADDHFLYIHIVLQHMIPVLLRLSVMVRCNLLLLQPCPLFQQIKGDPAVTVDFSRLPGVVQQHTVEIYHSCPISFIFIL